MSCIFCKIANKEIPAEIVFESDNIVAINDLHPQAPVHVLVMPKRHISSMNEINGENSHVIAEIFESIKIIAEKACIKDSGYRVLCNCGEDGGQTVLHLHYHILGGKKLSETF